MKKLRQLSILFLALVFALYGCGTKKRDAKAPGDAPPASKKVQAHPMPEKSDSDMAEPSDENGRPDDLIEISERMFIAQTNDIYLNPEEYLDKTIRYEGLYKNNLEWKEENENTLHFVIRFGPGCCGYDGEAGFEVRWDGEWPQVDDWVEATGVLKEEVYPSGMSMLYLELISLEQKSERGAEFVTT